MNLIMINSESFVQQPGTSVNLTSGERQLANSARSTLALNISNLVTPLHKCLKHELVLQYLDC
jgi:hypothetical protein